MALKVSDLIARFLRDKGMAHVFGIVGAGDAHIFDSIGTLGATEIVCVHHEQAATMAMQTYYRTCGTVTAAILTTGGGSTNGLTGVVGAWMDSIPGIVISGNENSRFTRADNPLRIWGVQGYDSSGLVAGVTKYAVRVLEPARILYELEKAFHIATSGKPGPVWIDVPMDVQAQHVEEANLARFLPEPTQAPDLAEAAAAVLAALRGAERPVLWLGNGIRLAGGSDKVAALLEALPVPALVSWAGVDLVDSDHPRLYGRAGTYGQRCANLVVQNADLVVAIGTRLAIPQIGYVLDEFARGADLIVVDIDPAEAAKHAPRARPVAADAGAFIDALLAAGAVPPPSPWIARCDAWRARYPWIGPEHDDAGGFINSYRFIDRLAPHLPADAHVVTDMGTALLCAHQALPLKPGQRLMTSTGLGEMGFGLPGAIGVSFAREEEGKPGEVLCLNCDGGMMMNLQELQTIAHHRLPIKIVVFNNDGYLMIKHTQTNLFAGRRVGTDRRTGVSCPDFSRLAAVFDMPAFRIRSWEEFDSVMPEALAADGPAMIEVFMDPAQLFLPKLSLAPRPDGTIVSPPLEDLSPLLPRDEMRANMIVGLHPKSAEL